MDLGSDVDALPSVLAAVTLQIAYNNGPTIAEAAATGVLTLSTTEAATGLLRLAPPNTSSAAALSITEGAQSTGDAMKVTLTTGAGGAGLHVTDGTTSTKVFAAEITGPRVNLSNAANATDLLALSRTFAGGGIAVAISMGATTTGNALDVDMVSGSTGKGLRIHQGATDYVLVGPTGALTATPASGQSIALTVAGAGTIALAGGDAVSMTGGSSAGGTIGFGSTGSITVKATSGRTVSIGSNNVSTHLVFGSAGQVTLIPTSGQDFTAPLAGSSQFSVTGQSGSTANVTPILFVVQPTSATSGNWNGVVIRGSATPGSGSAQSTWLQLNPTINGTSSGIATALAIASKTNVWTGGTINLVDFGTTSTDYFTGFTSQYRLDVNGDIFLGAVASTVAGATSGTSILRRTLQTTDATVTTIVTIPTSSGKCYELEAYVTGLKSDSTQGAGYRRFWVVRNNAGTLTAVGTTDAVDKEDDATWDVTVDTNSTNIRVRCTGKAATTINWRAIVNVLET